MATNIQYPMKKAVIDIGLFSFGVNALMLVMPLYMLQIYDRVLSSASIDIDGRAHICRLYGATNIGLDVFGIS